MIELQNVVKRFDTVRAIDDISIDIQKGRMYALVGTNGAGKSTLMRLMAGVYRPDGGTVTIGGKKLYKSAATREQLVYVSDEPYFISFAGLMKTALLYKACYPMFDMKSFSDYCLLFSLELRKPVETYSKGMRKLASIALALSCGADYLLLDETFDGLDVVMRTYVRRELYRMQEDRGCTVLLASHSLRELEDTCDNIILLHKGKALFHGEIDALAGSITRMQFAFDCDVPGPEAFIYNAARPIEYTRRSAVITVTHRCSESEMRAMVQSFTPVLCERLPVDLEEAIIYTLSEHGYPGAVKEIPHE